MTNLKYLDDPIVRALFTLMTVPLGADDSDEYRQMKGIVLASIETLVNTAGWQKQHELALSVIKSGMEEFAQHIAKKPSEHN